MIALEDIFSHTKRTPQNQITFKESINFIDFFTTKLSQLPSKLKKTLENTGFMQPFQQ